MIDNKYLKFILQVVATVLAAAYPMLSDGNFSTEEQINCVILLLGAIGVLGAGNLPEGVWKYTKFYVSVATAVVVAIAAAITGGINGAEWIQIVIAGLGAAGVVAAPGPTVLATGRHRASQ